MRVVHRNIEKSDSQKLEELAVYLIKTDLQEVKGIKILKNYNLAGELSDIKVYWEGVELGHVYRDLDKGGINSFRWRYKGQWEEGLYKGLVEFNKKETDRLLAHEAEVAVRERGILEKYPNKNNREHDK